MVRAGEMQDEAFTTLWAGSNVLWLHQLPVGGKLCSNQGHAIRAKVTAAAGS